jgi:hypothetical protein
MVGLIANSVKRTEELPKYTFKFAENYMQRQRVGKNLVAQNCNAAQSLLARNFAERASVSLKAFLYNLR